MAGRLVQRHLLAGADREQTLLACDGTRPGAARTGSLGGQGLGVVLVQAGQGAFDQASRGSGGNLLHGVEVEGGPLGHPFHGAAGSDFAPLGGQVADITE